MTANDTARIAHETAVDAGATNHDYRPGPDGGCAGCVRAERARFARVDLTDGRRVDEVNADALLAVIGDRLAEYLDAGDDPALDALLEIRALIVAPAPAPLARVDDLAGFEEYLERRDASPYVDEARVLVRRYRDHDHLEDVDLGDVPTCRACGLVLERAGDALVVPGPCVHRWVEDLANPELAAICEACGVFVDDVE